MTDNVAVTGVIIAAVFGLVGWVVNRILIEPLDRNTNALCTMAQEVQKLNNTHGQVLDRVDNCEDDIKKCNERITKLAKATNHTDVIL